MPARGVRYDAEMVIKEAEEARTMLLMDTKAGVAIGEEIANWPADAREAVAVLEGTWPPLIERRRTNRIPYRVAATMTLADAHPEAPAVELYTRDVSRWDMGFVTSQKVSIGSRVAVEVPLPDGSRMTVECTVRRCREFVDGWHDGVVHFKHDQPEFS